MSPDFGLRQARLMVRFDLDSEKSVPERRASNDHKQHVVRRSSLSPAAIASSCSRMLHGLEHALGVEHHSTRRRDHRAKKGAWAAGDSMDNRLKSRLSRATPEEVAATVRAWEAAHNRKTSRKARWLIDPRKNVGMMCWDLVTTLSLAFTALVTPFEVGPPRGSPGNSAGSTAEHHPRAVLPSFRRWRSCPHRRTLRSPWETRSFG